MRFIVIALAGFLAGMLFDLTSQTESRQRAAATPGPGVPDIETRPSAASRAAEFGVAAAADAGPGSLRAGLARARAVGDWAAFGRTLDELGRRGTPEAHRILVAVMGDPTLRLPGSRTGERFYGWLRGSEVPGTLAAARTRAEIDMAQHPGRAGGVGWLSLVARFGGDAEIGWIETLDDGRADRAMTEGAKNPLAAARYAERLRDTEHKLSSRDLGAFARENPDAALAAVSLALPQAARNRGRLLELLGRATAAETLGLAQRLIARVPREACLEALRAVDLMHRRGLDTSRFDGTIRAPLGSIDAYRSGDDPRAVLRALAAVQRNAVTWHRETLGAVRNLALRSDEPVARQAPSTIAHLERRLGRPAGTWDPER